MQAPQAWPVGVCVMPEPALNRPRVVAYPNYIDEILTHAGLCYLRVPFNQLEARLPELRLLVTVGEHPLPESLRLKLAAWLDGGGGWISIGGLCDMPQAMGAKFATGYQGWAGGITAMGEGYLAPEVRDHPSVAHIEKPLHFFSGVRVESAGAKVLATMLDAHGRATPWPVILEQPTNKGRAILIAADVTGTIVRIQQGLSVTRDGVSAPDGTAPVHDGVLKSGDGGVLDWLFDRDPVEGTPGLQAYLRPVADLWREVLLRSIFHLASELNVPLPLLWFYPRGLDAIAHMSHDTDGNEPEKCRRLLELLQQAEIKSTWCTILPGYDASLVRAIAEAGHEYATHYDAMTEGLHWSEAQFDRQLRELKQLFGGVAPVTNKNHYLRWEGDCELFEWCASRGIQLDQSKGASKAGEAGYNFGSCHPYLPVRFDGSTIDVLELATPTQDLNVFAPDTLLAPLLKATIKLHGILHLLFHPAHVMRQEVASALLDAVRCAKQQGLEWWTGAQINAWERARRKVRWSGYDAGASQAAVSLQGVDALEDATVLWLSPRGRGATVQRWGFTFVSEIRPLAAGAEHRLQLDLQGM
jgi:peptidoglycan/xylan/chitin deacetylase (PgdA/CDA1 family)